MARGFPDPRRCPEQLQIVRLDQRMHSTVQADLRRELTEQPAHDFGALRQRFDRVPGIEFLLEECRYRLNLNALRAMITLLERRWNPPKLSSDTDD